MNTAVFVFVVLATVALASAVGVVLFRSPVRSALSLVLTFFTLALMYFNLGAQLIGISLHDEPGIVVNLQRDGAGTQVVPQARELDRFT